MSKNKQINVQQYLCKFEARTLRSEHNPNGILSELEEVELGLSHEMMMQQWLQRCFDWYLHLEGFRFKNEQGQDAETLQELIASPQSVFECRKV